MSEQGRTRASPRLAPVQRARRAWLRAAVAALGCYLASPLATAQDPALAVSAANVKAAYLFKLPAYVDWPARRFERADSALTVGVLGASDVAAALAALTAGRTVNGRPVVVRRLSADDELAGVHVLFFADVTREQAERLAAAAAAENVLTVADTESAAQDSVIEFVTAAGKVRFEVRLSAAERNGLRLSAGLLSVAARVYGARGG
jgi:hypothetical protein